MHGRGLPDLALFHLWLPTHPDAITLFPALASALPRCITYLPSERPRLLL